MSSFGGEVKLGAAFCKILWNVKKSLPSMNKKYFAGPNSSFPLPVPPCCQMTADYTVKEQARFQTVIKF
jgi:hypothetical protein